MLCYNSKNIVHITIVKTYIDRVKSPEPRVSPFAPSLRAAIITLCNDTNTPTPTPTPTPTSTSTPTPVPAPSPAPAPTPTPTPTNNHTTTTTTANNNSNTLTQSLLPRVPERRCPVNVLNIHSYHF